MQTRPGEYNLDVLEALDFVLDTARDVGLKVMLSFADNWKFLGKSHNILLGEGSLGSIHQKLAELEEKHCEEEQRHSSVIARTIICLLQNAEYFCILILLLFGLEAQ